MVGCWERRLENIERLKWIFFDRWPRIISHCRKQRILRDGSRFLHLKCGWYPSCVWSTNNRWVTLEAGMNVTGENQPGSEGDSADANPQPSPDVRSSQPGTAGNQEFLRGVISIFILFNMIAILSWAIPLNVAPLPQIKQILRPYLLWTGLFQSWDFFAPNPRPVNSYIQAVVVTQDHHMRVFNFPRMEQLSYTKRYREERYRKFAEVLCDSRYAALWPDVARHVARSLNNSTGPPQMVILMKFQTPILYGVTPAQEPAAKPEFFYEYYVSSGDLR